MLEKYSIKKAHFHWFKGDLHTIERMRENEYFISITPDVLYEKEIRKLVKNYPLSLMMVETDGPWRFEDIFKHKLTHPKMIHNIIREISFIKEVDIRLVYETLYKNTIQFYNLAESF
jgi:TatD DNase family protein